MSFNPNSFKEKMSQYCNNSSSCDSHKCMIRVVVAVEAIGALAGLFSPMVSLIGWFLSMVVGATLTLAAVAIFFIFCFQVKRIFGKGICSKEEHNHS